MENTWILAEGMMVFTATYFFFRRRYPESRWAMIFWWTSLGLTLCALVFLRMYGH